MDSSIYRKTEGIMYSHYRKKKRVERLRGKLIRVELRIDRLMADIRNCRVNLRDTLKAIDYGNDKVQNNSTQSNIERELEKAVDVLILELEQAQREKRKTAEKIRYVEKKTDDIDVVLEQLTEEELRIVELKYGDKMTFRQIAEAIHSNRSTIQREKDKIVWFTADELNLGGTKQGQNRDKTT